MVSYVDPSEIGGPNEAPRRETVFSVMAQGLSILVDPSFVSVDIWTDAATDRRTTWDRGIAWEEAEDAIANPIPEKAKQAVEKIAEGLAELRLAAERIMP